MCSEKRKNLCGQSRQCRISGDFHFFHLNSQIIFLFFQATQEKIKPGFPIGIVGFECCLGAAQRFVVQILIVFDDTFQ